MLGRMPIVRMDRLGRHRPGRLALAGLGQSSDAFSEEALQQKLQELQQVRSEVAAVEDEIEAVRSGRPAAPAQTPAPEPATAPTQQAPVIRLPSRAIPGGTINLPVVGSVPTLGVAAAAAAAFYMWRRS